MCGIIGAIGKVEEIHKNAISFIAHRGPDSEGSFMQKGLLLGHTRLSIQDLSENGNQPMFSSDGRYVIIFNGEIYNHQELRKELLSDIKFKSKGDTETVLYGYIKYGVDILKKLNGIFALAIFDKKTEDIIIARDHFGVKPLYFYQDNERFLFGSEIKSFLTFNIDKAISIESLSNYVSFLWSPGYMTPFAHVQKLLPGNFLKFNISKFAECNSIAFYKEEYHQFKKSYSEEALIDQLEEKLLHAVERQMLSDVPVGFFLSGGLDSSLLVAMARKLYPKRKFNCYTIDVGKTNANSEGFSEDLFYAKEVAKILNVDLNVVKADIDIVGLFDKMIWHLDEPQADAAPLNVLKIAQLARDDGIKVLIGGAAGDDLFSGYRRHKALNYEKYFNNIPKWGRNGIQFLIKTLPSNTPAFRRIKKLFANLDKTSRQRQLSYFEWLPRDTVYSLFSNEYKAHLTHYNPFEYFDQIEKEMPAFNSDLDRMLFWEMKTFLVYHNLNYTDKLAMAVGVEARVPYLDLDLVEFAQQIPAEMKMKNKEVKYILKKVAERYLPKEIIYRPKTGFGAPVRQWITKDLNNLIQDRLSPEKIKKRGIFDANKVWKLIEDNKSGKVDASYSIWSLLAIESWCIQFIDEVKP